MLKPQGVLFTYGVSDCSQAGHNLLDWVPLACYQTGAALLCAVVATASLRPREGGGGYPEVVRNGVALVVMRGEWSLSLELLLVESTNAANAASLPQGTRVWDHNRHWKPEHMVSLETANSGLALGCATWWQKHVTSLVTAHDMLLGGRKILCSTHTKRGGLAGSEGHNVERAQHNGAKSFDSLALIMSTELQSVPTCLLPSHTRPFTLHMGWPCEGLPGAYILGSCFSPRCF